MLTSNHQMSLESPPKNRNKVEYINKHKYPEIRLSADNDVSMRRNLELLKVESLNSSLSHENLKTLMAHTYTACRAALLDSQFPTFSSFIKEFPVLKRRTYVRKEIYVMIATYNLLYTRQSWSLNSSCSNQT